MGCTVRLFLSMTHRNSKKNANFVYQLIRNNNDLNL